MGRKARGKQKEHGALPDARGSETSVHVGGDRYSENKVECELFVDDDDSIPKSSLFIY
jgi:hypothetical protein